MDDQGLQNAWRTNQDMQTPSKKLLLYNPKQATRRREIAPKSWQKIEADEVQNYPDIPELPSGGHKTILLPNKILIEHDNLSDDELIYQIRNKFSLNEYPFNDMDDDLLILAFTNDDTLNNSATKYRLSKKYKSTDLQTLEKIGDIVYNSIAIDIIDDIVKLEQSPKFLTDVMSYMTSNRVLFEIMNNKSVCRLLRSNNYAINFNSKIFHNPCADAFESLIAALYKHLKFKNLDTRLYLKYWILKNTIFADLLKLYFIEHNISYPVFVPNNKKRIASKIIDKKYSPDYSLIVTESEDLYMIYRQLGWDKYLKSLEPNRFGKFNIIVPSSEHEIKFSKQSAMQYLLNMGYITPIKV